MEFDEHGKTLYAFFQKLVDSELRFYVSCSFRCIIVLIFLFVKTGERLQALHEEEKEGGEALLYDSWTYKVPRDRVHI